MSGSQPMNSVLLCSSAYSEAPHTCTAVLVISRVRQLYPPVCVLPAARPLPLYGLIAITMLGQMGPTARQSLRAAS